MYIQVVESDICRDWNWLNMSQFNLNVPNDYVNPAGQSICDLQLDQFDNQFKPITEPLVAFK
jgi:hypothetical protein